ncbi:hypothetical protein ACFP3I_18340 [Chryseobacterium arachidis]
MYYHFLYKIIQIFLEISIEGRSFSKGFSDENVTDRSFQLSN